MFPGGGRFVSDTNPDAIGNTYSSARVPNLGAGPGDTGWSGFGPGDYSGGYTGAGDSIYWGAFDDTASSSVQTGPVPVVPSVVPVYVPIITPETTITDPSTLIDIAKGQAAGAQARAVDLPAPPHVHSTSSDPRTNPRRDNRRGANPWGHAW